jgi:hypothetical protein
VGIEPPVLGSILTRQYRFATRGIEIGVWTARQAIDLAGGIVDEVAGRLGLRNGNGHSPDDVFSGEVAPDAEPRPAPHRARPAPSASAAAPPAPPPEPAVPSGPAPERLHVSTEPELVRESAEPGAEDGAGAQIRVDEPWPAYRHMKARDVIARLSFATRAELAAVELFELAHANRTSVVVAAQRALKKASPPR